jgi:hypothetical protein
MDLGEVGWGDVDWIGPARDRNTRNSVLNLWVPWNAGNYRVASRVVLSSIELVSWGSGPSCTLTLKMTMPYKWKPRLATLLSFSLCVACASLESAGLQCYNWVKTNKLCGLRPRANYTDRTTAACWRRVSGYFVKKIGQRYLFRTTIRNEIFVQIFNKTNREAWNDEEK